MIFSKMKLSRVASFCNTFLEGQLQRNRQTFDLVKNGVVGLFGNMDISKNEHAGFRPKKIKMQIVI